MTERAIKYIGGEGNYLVAQTEGRQFPGVLVQGDTLSILLAQLEEENPDGWGTETVREWLEYYERIMSEAGLKLPYSR